METIDQLLLGSTKILLGLELEVEFHIMWYHLVCSNIKFMKIPNKNTTMIFDFVVIILDREKINFQCLNLNLKKDKTKQKMFHF